MNASALDDNLRQQAERALKTGDFAASARLYEQLLPEVSPASGTEDADALAARVQYALALYGLADYPAGETQLRHVLHGQQQLLGLDHPDTLTTTARLADNLGEQDRWTEAGQLARAAVERATTVLGTEHSASLTCRLTLAWVQYHTAPHESEEVIRATARDIVAVHGDGHRDAWAARHLLIETLWALNQTDEAESEAHALIALREERQGAEHPHTLRARADLALVLHTAGQTDQARALIDDVAETSSRVLGGDHPYTAGIRATRSTIAA
ncbi:tetratricopeptide repeat protein [Streptomyces sp. NPDC047072]|uniref:tetratricopeptide repeat protein n=1 Tax=Streptomyces sp. NPDC047072 TaxID=3154809 RepID=UPI0033FB9C7A